MDLSSIALQGLAQAQVQLEAAAGLSSAAAASPDGSNPDIMDLSAQMAALMSAENLVSINLNTLKMADQIQKQVINLVA